MNKNVFCDEVAAYTEEESEKFFKDLDVPREIFQRKNMTVTSDVKIDFSGFMENMNQTDFENIKIIEKDGRGKRNKSEKTKLF